MRAEIERAFQFFEVQGNMGADIWDAGVEYFGEITRPARHMYS
jgi:hypothetical protein